MKAKIGLLTVVALLVTVAMTGTVAADPGTSVTNVVRFDPQDSSVAEYCQTVEVQVYADLVEDCAGGALVIEYDEMCANVTDWVLNSAAFGFGTWNSTVDGVESIIVLADPAVTGTVLIGTLSIHCICDASDCTTALTFIDGSVLGTPSPAQPLDVDWQNGSFTCGEPPPCIDAVVVSGTMPDYPDPEESGVTGPLADFIPQDEFAPCEWVWVYGEGFGECQEYEIYIQPYDECHSVVEGQPLDHSLSVPLGYPDAAGSVKIRIEPDGTFGPVALFHVEKGFYCTLWEIVADKIGPDHQAGVYNCAEDGLDAVACDEWGFHIWPEAMTITLLSAGLVGLGGYYGLRRRKDSVSDN